MSDKLVPAHLSLDSYDTFLAVDPQGVILKIYDKGKLLPDIGDFCIGTGLSDHFPQAMSAGLTTAISQVLVNHQPQTLQFHIRGSQTQQVYTVRFCNTEGTIYVFINN